METKTFKGKAIYQPNGKAGEYSHWACNFYKGCSNGCTYCYCKKGVLKKTIGGDTPTLKKCFKNEAHALEIFENELKANLPELQKHGLFFSFTTDPLLQETVAMTLSGVYLAVKNGVHVKILTKKVNFIEQFLCNIVDLDCGNIACGFTLTGHDELEPNASTNADRIESMRKLHDAGFKTWASIEPVIDFRSSMKMIANTYGICDLYKIGLESGKKYDNNELIYFINHILENCSKLDGNPVHYYFKDSLLQQAGISRADLPSNCVGRDYNMFNE